MTTAASRRPTALVTGSGSTTGLNVIKALAQDPTIGILGCDIEDGNPAQRYCETVLVPRASDISRSFKGPIRDVTAMPERRTAEGSLPGMP